MPGQITKMDMVGRSYHIRMDREPGTYVYIEGEEEPRRYPVAAIGYIIKRLEADGIDCSVLRKALDENPSLKRPPLKDHPLILGLSDEWNAQRPQ